MWVFVALNLLVDNPWPIGVSSDSCPGQYAEYVPPKMLLYCWGQKDDEVIHYHLHDPISTVPLAYDCGRPLTDKEWCL